jgi:hypothetical protein
LELKKLPRKLKSAATSGSNPWRFPWTGLEFNLSFKRACHVLLPRTCSSESQMNSAELWSNQQCNEPLSTYSMNNH